MLQASRYHKTSAELAGEASEILAAKKDPALFAPLYNRYYEQIFRFLYQRMDDKDQAFDCTQQVFVKAMSNLHKYEDRGVPFASWLYRIAFTTMNDMFRKDQSARTINIDTAGLHVMMEEAGESRIDQYHDKIVQIIGEQLEEDDLHLIEMRFFEKRSFKEIAEIIGTTENNAKVKTYRILERLRKQLK